ncbi:hypothetical protein PO878_03185 [Iamia majanohamensis]|uniref:Cytochrome P450 n=1 Tax=Iamia majanohamensis TaxID=467976 RepID=A0AAE9YFR3_9ACTN|nr:hypothetical protein [Iamia majanohamensis]WCO67727.1 hypothetical protein PO878_03185 [Iamia majanohamensis]
MTRTDRLLAVLGWRGVLPAPAAALVECRTGFRQVLTRRSTVEALLAHPEVLVTYGPASRLLGLGDFPLACDGSAHAAARARIARALDRSAGARRRGEDAAAEVADAAVLAAGPRLDVVTGLVDPALAAWVEGWFGLPGWGPTLARIGRLVLLATALEPETPRARADQRGRDAALRAVDRARPALDEAVRDAAPGTLAASLLTESGGDVDAAVADLVGLTVGPLALGSWSLALVVDGLLDDPIQLAGPGSATEAAWLFDRTLARRAPLPGLPRQCGAPVEVGDGGAHHRLPAGPVLAATRAAAGAEGTGTPTSAANLAFGSGPHRCMGQHEVTVVAGIVLRALADGRPRRRPGRRGRPLTGAAPSGVGRWPFPGHLVVRLDR